MADLLQHFDIESRALLDPAKASACEIDALYAMRWNIEVDFRTLKADIG